MWAWTQHFPQDCMCSKRTLRSACASVQFDQRLRRELCGQPRFQCVFRWTAKTDQTSRMHMPIWIFTGRSCDLVRNGSYRKLPLLRLLMRIVMSRQTEQTLIRRCVTLDTWSGNNLHLHVCCSVRFWNTKPLTPLADTCANSVDPDETAHNEPSHLDLHCLQSGFELCVLLNFSFATRDMSKFERWKSPFQKLRGERV